MFGRKAPGNTDDALRASRLRSEQEEDLRKLQADLRKAREVARNWTPRDAAASRAHIRDLNMNIEITKANIRFLQR